MNSSGLLKKFPARFSETWIIESFTICMYLLITSIMSFSIVIQTWQLEQSKTQVQVVHRWRISVFKAQRPLEALELIIMKVQCFALLKSNERGPASGWGWHYHFTIRMPSNQQHVGVHEVNSNELILSCALVRCNRHTDNRQLYWRAIQISLFVHQYESLIFHEKASKIKDPGQNIYPPLTLWPSAGKKSHRIV